MRKFFLMITALLLSWQMPVMADVSQTIVINGETVTKVATRLTFNGDNVIVYFSDDTSQKADMNDVTIVFSGLTSIRDISTFRLKKEVEGCLNLEGLAPGTEVMIYDAAGKLQLRSVSSSINVRSLKSGVYVLKAGSQIVKFVKH